MTTLTITHTHPEGTLIDGTARGDGSAPALKANRWRWSRNLGAWYIPGSRDHHARDWQIRATAEALREAGFEVEVEVDNTPRATADVQADKVARASARADALDAKSERLEATSEARHGAARQIADGIPFGQPILVGHHSERRARRDAERIHNNMRAAVDADAAARETARRAEAARANTRPESPATTANRLDKLRADLRRIQRHRDGYTVVQGRTVIAEVNGATGDQHTYYDTEAARLQEQITYWEQVREQQIADGLTVDTSTARAGDLVKVHGSDWWRIKRVNPKTFTVTWGHSEIRVPHHNVTALRAADGTQNDR